MGWLSESMADRSERLHELVQTLELSTQNLALKKAWPSLEHALIADVP